MAKIFLINMNFHAYHGCFKEEKIVGAHFSVNCNLHLGCTTAAVQDDLRCTVNYQDVYDLIAQEMEQPSSLLENVAYRIVKRLHEQFPEIGRVSVSINKLNPQLGGKVGGVSISLGSEDLEEFKALKRKKKGILNDNEEQDSSRKLEDEQHISTSGGIVG